MKKNILLFVLMLTAAIISDSQDEPNNIIIQRLESKLPTLQGRQLVDTLVRIARIRLDSRYDKWDSSLYYSGLAINEAKKID